MKNLRIPATTALALIAAALLTPGCSNKMKLADPQSSKNHPRSLAATVNGVPVFWESVDRRGRGFLKDEQEFNGLAFAPEKEAEALDFFRRRATKIEVMRLLLLEEVRQQRIVVTDKDRQNALLRLQPIMARRNWTTNDFFTRSPLGEEQTRAEFEESVYIDKLLDERVIRPVTVTEGDLDAAVVEIGRIRKEKSRQAEELHRGLADGADFAQVATRFSECPISARSGGVIGTFTRGTLDPAVEQAVFALKTGAISAVLETTEGFQIYKVTAHTPARAATATTPAAPETVALSRILVRFKMPNLPEIRQLVLRSKVKQAVNDHYRKLVAAATIKCAFPDLAFDEVMAAR